MFELNKPLSYSLLILVGSAYLLYQYKHPRMFDEEGSFRPFGLQDYETLTPFWLVITLLSLATYNFVVTRDINFV
jgi:hypothetical protein